MLTITEIEDGIIDRLKSEMSYLKTCGSIGEFLLDKVEDITVRFPAAYVIYSGGEFENLAGGAQDRVMIFTVLFMAKNMRGGETPRHGEGSDKGAYDLLEDGRAALTNQTCDLDISALLPEDEESVEGSKQMAIYAIRFRTRCEET